MTEYYFESIVKIFFDRSLLNLLINLNINQVFKSFAFILKFKNMTTEND